MSQTLSLCNADYVTQSSNGSGPLIMRPLSARAVSAFGALGAHADGALHVPAGEAEAIWECLGKHGLVELFLA